MYPVIYWTVFYKTKDSTNIKKSILALTEVGSDMSWPETIYIKEEYSDNIIRVFEDNWICNYPRPDKVVHDNVTKFTGW